MKYIITESKLENAIMEYINNTNIIPDYGWSTPEEYKEELNRWGEVMLYLNDDTSFRYFGCNSGDNEDDMDFSPSGRLYHFECPLLQVWPSVSYQLNNLFGDLWKPVLKKWFEENTGLEVSEITDEDI
jgi:hypothetical protein